MKKLRVLVVLFILTFSFSVEAKVVLKVNCDKEEVTSDSSVTCEGTLRYATEGIDDIEISYDTNLDIKFNSVKDFSYTITDNKISIHSNTTLYDEIMFSTKIMEFTLSSNDKCSEEEKISFNNIVINKANDIKVGDVTKTFSVKKIEVIDIKPTPIEEIKQSSVCTLESISIDDIKLLNFDKNKFEYDGINVNKETPFIRAVRTDDKSSASGLGNVFVPAGETVTREITVLAEDGTKCIYKLYFTNNTTKPTSTPTATPSIDNKDEILPDEEVKSNDNTLKSLEIYNNKKKIDFKFDSKHDKFDINVEDVDKVTIKASLNDSKASFDNVLKPRDVTLDLIDNEIIIKVIAENGDEKTYTLNIHVNKMGSNNKLISLKINDKEINLADEKLEIRVPNSVTKTKIEAIANDEKAIVKYEDIDLKVGDNGVNITVTSEDGNTEEYDVNVIREDEKVLFEKLVITGYNISFIKEKHSYSLKVDKDTNELDIQVVPSNIDFQVVNNKNIHNGSKINVIVTDANGSYEYIINIEKDSTTLNLVCYSVFGIGVIALIASIINFIKKKKSI